MQLFGIPPKNALGRAGLAAGGTVTAIEPGNTEITLYRNFGVIVKLHRPEGTGLETFTAADTKLIVDEHQAALIPDYRFHRT
jgi:hypothetical protein